MPTYVPFVDPRSSTYQRSWSRVSMAWLCETEPSAEQSICGMTLRPFERRPINALVPGSGTTVGAPLVAQVPAASCDANQSGSTHNSATQSAPGVALRAAACADGIWPVVKSYPHSSQNSASGKLVSPQFGQVCGGATTVGESNVNDDFAGVGTGAAAPAIGSPHTSQKSSVFDVWPCGHVAGITSPSSSWSNWYRAPSRRAWTRLA